MELSASSWTSVPFPAQPSGVPWPTHEWPKSAPDDDVDQDGLRFALDRLFQHPDETGLTLATVVVHRGRIVAERYGVEADSVWRKGSAVETDTPLISWSMAKSITHALVGIAVADGLVAVDEPAPVSAWRHDDRRRITLQHLLQMRSGLRFVEDYTPGGESDVIEMLFGSGQHDVASFAAAFGLDAEPGSVWSYSSGTSNIVARIVGDAVGGGEDGMRTFMHDRLFGPIGMKTADPRFDAAGTFIGSSFVYASARDFARFGYLYLRGGQWDGESIIPAGWADHARTPTEVPNTEVYGYGAHWWRWYDQPGSLACHGYEGQRTVVLPAKDLVVVRLGKTVEARRVALQRLLDAVVAAFPDVR
jgi:CubicO group peptidase (beta-lactamase class C family)